MRHLLILLLPALAWGQKQDTTCVKQRWTIQIGPNQYAIKDTTYCFPSVGTGIVCDTIFLTKNVLYKGEKGDPGAQGPQGLPGMPGVCPTCPPSGGGGGTVTPAKDSYKTYVDDYGAIPNDGKPDDAAFAAATEASIRGGGRSIVLGYGQYDLTFWNATKPVQGIYNNFAPIIITGQGRADEGAVGEKFTKIKCANTSGPCITANAFRLAEMRDFIMEGNNGEKVAAMVAKGDTTCWRAENWVASGNSIDKYEHQSAIAFDYAQTQPPWSAQGLFERIKISGFVVGISVSPSAGNMQADTYWFRDIKLENNIYAVSVGQDQARSITFENLWVNSGYCGFVNNRFGRGNGSAFNVTGGQYTSLFKLLETTNAYRGQSAITGIFMEACGIIGSVNGLGINTNSTVFTGSEIGLDDDGYINPRPGVWVTPFATMSAGGNIVFTGCNIHSKKKIIAFGGNQYQFIGTTFTETYPVFPNDQNTVSITGRPLFEFSRAITDMVDLPAGLKKYVRYGTSFVRYRGGKPPYYSVQPANVYVPYWAPGVWQPLPDTQAKQFEWAVPANEIRWFRVGDYIDCQAKNGLISGMGTDFGQAMVPGLEVIEVKEASLVLRRVAPEMRVESWYRAGQVWSEPYLFASSSYIGTPQVPITNTLSVLTGERVAVGPTVTLENGKLLAPGDYVWDGQSIARVLEVNGDIVTFNRTILSGKLYSVN